MSNIVEAMVKDQDWYVTEIYNMFQELRKQMKSIENDLQIIKVRLNEVEATAEGNTEN